MSLTGSTPSTEKRLIENSVREIADAITKSSKVTDMTPIADAIREGLQSIATSIEYASIQKRDEQEVERVAEAVVNQMEKREQDRIQGLFGNGIPPDPLDDFKF